MRTIAQIDKDITANRKQLRSLERIDRSSAASWQDAWDKHPDLRAREDALFLERGNAQAARDEAAEKARRQAARKALTTKAKRKTCPTCGSVVLAA